MLVSLNNQDLSKWYETSLQLLIVISDQFHPADRAKYAPPVVWTTVLGLICRMKTSN